MKSIKGRILRLSAATLGLQLSLLAYLTFAPWQELNDELENSFEDYALSSESGDPAIESAALEVVPLPPVQQKKTRPRLRPRTTDVLYHTVKKGETLSTIWNRYAGNLDRFEEARAAFDRAGMKSPSLKTGERVQLAIRKGGDIRRIKKRFDDGRVAVLEIKDDVYTAHVASPKIKEQHKVVTARILGSFVRSAREAGVPYEIIDELVDLFSHRIDFSKDLQPGDTFSIMFNEKRSRSKSLGAHVEAASFRLRDHTHAVIRHGEQHGRPRYFDEEGKVLGNYFLRYPLKFTRITSVFSKARVHPIFNITTAHPGVDLAAPSGTAVRSVADGMVKVAAFHRGAGNMIQLMHGAGVATVYMHLSKFGPGIRTGARVTRGQLIGSVGSTGWSTGPHLDYRLSIKGRYVNPLTAPLPQLLAPGDAIPKRLLQATLTTLNSRHEEMLLAQQELKEKPRA